MYGPSPWLLKGMKRWEKESPKAKEKHFEKASPANFI